MPQHIKIISDFDITETKITRNYKEDSLPKKICGQLIKSKDEWVKKRRQQTNLETIMQIISLRTQPYNVRTTKNNDKWILEFDIEHPDVYRKGDDPLGLLKEDLNDVPMIVGLDEKSKLDNLIIVGKNVKLETYEI